MHSDQRASFEALVERFRKLGCSDPESWARSEIEEDIPQLARFAFLRRLWDLVITPQTRRDLNRFGGPNDDGHGGALRRIKDCGVNMDDLLTIVREAQIDVIHGIADLIDELVEPGPEYDGISWGLYEVDDDFRPTRSIDSLHESIDDAAPNE